MLRIRWTGFLVALLCATLVVLAFVSRKPLCIESSVVEKIDRVRSESTAVVWSCEERRHVPFDLAFSELLPRLDDEIQSIEAYLSELGPLDLRLQLSWLEGRQNTFRWRGQRIYFSDDFLKDSNWLPKIFFKAWLRSRIQVENFAESPAEESLSDLMLMAYRGDKNNPFRGLSPEPYRWPLVLKSLKPYCKSSWRTLEHITVCQSLQGAAKTEISMLVPMSVRPLLTDSLVDAWGRLDRSEQFQLFKALGQSSRENHPKLNVNPASGGSGVADLLGEKIRASSAPVRASFNDQSDLMRAVVEVDRLSDLVRGLGVQSLPWKRMAEFFEQAINRRGFSGEEGGASLDVAFLIPSFDLAEGRESWLAYLNALALQFPGQLMGIVSDQSLWVLPTQEPIQKSILPQVRARRAVSIACQLPNLNELISHAKSFEKLLVVNDCEKTAKLKFRGYLESGVDSFARENKEVAFVQMHLPSLLLAWRRDHVNPLPLIAQEKWKAQFFAVLGWQNPKFDDRLKIYKTKSVIEAIEAYRLKVN